MIPKSLSQSVSNENECRKGFRTQVPSIHEYINKSMFVFHGRTAGRVDHNTAAEQEGWSPIPLATGSQQYNIKEKSTCLEIHISFPEIAFHATPYFIFRPAKWGAFFTPTTKFTTFIDEFPLSTLPSTI